jgi:hypothetical protein
MRAWAGFNQLRIGFIFGVFTVPSVSSSEGVSASHEAQLSLKKITITIATIIIIRIELKKVNYYYYYYHHHHHHHHACHHDHYILKC